MELFQNPLGWDVGDEDFDLLSVLDDTVQESPPACWPLPNLAMNTVPRQSDEEQDANIMPASSHLIRDAQPADTPWVSKLNADEFHHAHHL